MKTRFILLCLAASMSLSAQECLQIDYSDERNIEAIENQYAFLKSLHDKPSILNRNSQSSELNVPLNFHFFYDPGDRIVREELIIATINRTNEILQMNNIDVNVYLGCVTHEFNEPDLVVWEEVNIGFNTSTVSGVMNINLGNIEFAILSISDLFSYGINVFVPRNIVGAAGLGGLAGPARIIALDRDEVINGGRGSYLDNGDGTFTNQFNAESTLAHELGHYCGLFHTDEGGVLANILQGNIPNPLGLFFARCREEAVNRERNYTFFESILCGHTGRVCASSADGLCDTNADPGIVGTFALTGCQIPVTAGNLAIADTWGTPYLTQGEEPMTQNMMSQRLEDCRWEFSNLQRRIITNFLNSRFGDNLANPDQYEPNDSNDQFTRTPIALNEVQLHTRHELTCDDQLDPVDNLIFSHDVTTNNSTLSQYVVTIADVSGENNPVADVVMFEANANEVITGFAIATRENIGTETRYTISNVCNAHPDNYIIQVRFNNTGDNEIDLGCYNISISEEPAIRMLPFGEEIVCSNQQFEIVGAPPGAIINWTSSTVTLDQTVGSIVNMISFTPNAAEYWVRAEITDGNCTKTIVNEFLGVSTASRQYEIREIRESCWDEFDQNGHHTFGSYQIFPRPIGVDIEWLVVGANIEFGNNPRIVRASPDSPGGFSLGVNIVDECGLTSVTWEDFASVECFQFCVGTGTNLNVQHCELNVDLDLKLNAKSSYSYIITSQENKLLMDSAEYMTGKKFAVDVSAYPESDYMLHLYCSVIQYVSIHVVMDSGF